MNTTDVAGRAPLEVRNIQILREPVSAFLQDAARLGTLRDDLFSGDIVVLKSFARSDEIERLKDYLHAVMISSMEEYVPRRVGAKNNFRISFDDERAIVKGWFCSWSFYPWNQDLFSLFKRYDSIYELRNSLTGLPSRSFLGRTPDLGCIARLAVQFYPRGKGYMAAHTDPYDRHQTIVPIMAMSKSGVDFQTGGNFVMRKSGERINTEEFVDPGDILLFHTQCVHGVEPVDRGLPFDPLGRDGRWMMLFAVNKLEGTTDIGDATMVTGD